MTPDDRIDRIVTVFAELSLKLDQLLDGYARTLTALKGEGRAAKETTSLSSNSNEFREEVILGETYKKFTPGMSTDDRSNRLRMR